MINLRIKMPLIACILTMFAIVGPTARVPVSVSNQLTLVTGDENEAEPQEFPWQVSLRANLNNFHFCGGVIIDLRTVLTTASCADLSSPYMTTLVAGNIDLNTTNCIPSQQIVQVTSVHIHPNYAETSDYSNDIAILKVNPAFVFNENVAPIPSLQKVYSIPSESGIITGWGTKREEEISLQEKLQKATVKLIHSNEECRSLTEGFNVTVEETVVCMTSPSQSNSSVDSCTGDQGGPLVFYENDVPVLAGLISYGIGCGRQNLPSFCTRVSPYLEFIQLYQET